MFSIMTTPLEEMCAALKKILWRKLELQTSRWVIATYLLRPKIRYFFNRPRMLILYYTLYCILPPTKVPRAHIYCCFLNGHPHFHCCNRLKLALLSLPVITQSRFVMREKWIVIETLTEYGRMCFLWETWCFSDQLYIRKYSGYCKSKFALKW